MQTNTFPAPSPVRSRIARALVHALNFAAGTILALGAIALHAQPAGSLAGRVTDASTGLSLAGARVAIVGTGLETYTGPAGDYHFPNVPAGAVAVEVDYVGYPVQVRTVEVGGPTRLNLVFNSETVALDKMVIDGAVVGAARAINQQRAAATLSNVVASDEIGNFPDQNAAEAIQRIPGISLYRDQGEGRYIVLRGLNYNYTTVKVNGGAFAGADMGDRSTPLDVIPADALAAIEVTKVPTPDMDGEGLGGQVNIKTKSPFENDGLAASFTAQGQFARQGDRTSGKFNGWISQRFGADRQYGILVSPSWQSRKFGSYNFENGGDWVAPSDNGTSFYTPAVIEFRDYEITRDRHGLNVSFEARPDDGTVISLNAGHNRFTDTESRHMTIFDFAEGTLDKASVSAQSATYTGLRRYGRRLRIREKDQEVSTISLAGERQLEGWKLDWQAGLTKGTERRPDELTARFRRNTRDAIIRYDSAGTYTASVTQLAGASFFEPSSYNFHRVDLANESGTETEADFLFNARYDLPARPAYVKFGGRFRTKDKDAESEVSELTAVPATFTFANLAEAPSDYPYLRVPRISTAAVREAFYSSRGAFTGTRVFEDSEFEDFLINEDVLSAYAMAGASAGRLNVIGGVRLEHTKFSTSGKELDLVRSVATLRNIGRSYTNVLPGLHFRYDVNHNLVLRASWSNSLARPSFGDTAYRSLVNSDDREITRGNPMLEPLEGTNWDASVEYYLPSLGVLSASVFHKQIENFSYEYEDPNPVVIGGVNYDLTTYANGSEGSISGLELAYQQQLRFLPAPFDGFGVMANATFLDSEATYPTRPGEQLPFIGQSDLTGNLGLTYEKGPVFLRLALNFRTERLREDEALRDSVPEDIYVDDFQQLDLTARYKLGRNWELYAEMLNITDEPFLVFLRSDNGQGNRLVQLEEYGWSANFGIRWKL